MDAYRGRHGAEEFDTVGGLLGGSVYVPSRSPLSAEGARRVVKAVEVTADECGVRLYWSVDHWQDGPSPAEVASAITTWTRYRPELRLGHLECDEGGYTVDFYDPKECP